MKRLVAAMMTQHDVAILRRTGKPGGTAVLRPGLKISQPKDGPVTDNTPATEPTFKRVGAQVNIPELEARVLVLWDEVDAFPKSVEMWSEDSEYTFYDGPPFPTGSPHYGNLLAGVIKDIVPRYWTMRGHRVERRFGWDTHGLPIEMEVQKDLGLSGPRQIEEFGVANFNEACRNKVQANTERWEYITRRLGRWIDFENDYKTMDVEFMESVWWVFRGLWDRGLVYQDFKVVPYSWGAGTPLSNFELNLGGYRDVEDPSVTLRFAVTDDHGPATAGDYLLIWTTTPWTLPGNLAVAVGTDITYSRVLVDDAFYWVARDLVESVWNEEDGAKEVATAVGSDLLGAKYEPPFDHFLDQRERGGFVVIASEETSTEEGTGLVHMAPAYGEADFLAFQNSGIEAFVDPIDLEAKFTDAVPEVAGQFVKDADKTLLRLLKDKGLVVRSGTIVHSYPFCWRTDTPLIYKAIPSWYIKVESFKERMAELNKGIWWVPDYVGERRFGNWLKDARDWAVSRNRFWGSCIPVWVCDECDERVCIGSRAELQELSGIWLDDLHKHIVDEVTFECTECSGTMERVPEVLDVWFESGSMPYGKMHYPFANEERFTNTFPADFIAEGLDQTRGWFYTLVVLAAALFDDVPFKNCVVNGMILAEDGRKMSKSLKNYPDPDEIFDGPGADALRAYLINSPVLRAEPLRFSEEGVREVVRTVLLPFWNAFSFFTIYAEADGITRQDIENAPALEQRSELDRWIVSVLQSLVRDVNQEMEHYRLYNVVPPILGFIDDLTNWYIRRSRRRFWAQRGGADESDKIAAFATLYEVLITFSKVAAPVLPFITEEIYQSLVRSVDADAPESVHHNLYPQAEDSLIDPDLEAAMDVTRRVVNLGRGLRKREQLRVRQPLSRLTVVTRDPLAQDGVGSHTELIAEELNVKEVAIDSEEGDLVHLSAKANFKTLGPRFGPRMREVASAIAALDHDQIATMLEAGATTIGEDTLTAEDVVVDREPRSGIVVAADRELTIVLDTALT
ncbi:MAG: isoleucine--tRNA ligase, partial [Acidimicrobiia bacterium]|nr:isoleucine--tRNA ligase [Acidimicrobiia bacterium]